MTRHSTYEEILKKHPKEWEQWKKGLANYIYHRTPGDREFKDPTKKSKTK
jgi:hypothetical protein